MKYMVLLLLIAATNSLAQKQKAEYYIYNKDWNAAKDLPSAEYVVQATTGSRAKGLCE